MAAHNGLPHQKRQKFCRFGYTALHAGSNASCSLAQPSEQPPWQPAPIIIATDAEQIPTDTEQISTDAEQVESVGFARQATWKQPRGTEVGVVLLASGAL